VNQRGFCIAIDAQRGRYNVSICFLGAKIPCSLWVEAASLFGEGPTAAAVMIKPWGRQESAAWMCGYRKIA
jgi:hypothetical protein